MAMKYGTVKAPMNTLDIKKPTPVVSTPKSTPQVNNTIAPGTTMYYYDSKGPINATTGEATTQGNNTYVTTQANPVAPVGQQPVIQPVEKPKAVDNSPLINQQYDSLVSALKAQIQKSINDKQLQIGQLPQQYQPLKNDSEVRKYNELRTALEQSSNMGDRGGIGRQNALLTQTEGENRLNNINLQQETQKNTLTNDISNLGLEQTSKEADINASRLRDLISNNVNMDETNYSRLRDALTDKRYDDTTSYNKGQDSLNRQDNINAQLGLVNEYANVKITPEIRQTLTPFMSDIQGAIDKGLIPSSLIPAAKALRFEKVKAMGTDPYTNPYIADYMTQDGLAKLYQNKELMTKLNYLEPSLKVELDSAITKLKYLDKSLAAELENALLVNEGQMLKNIEQKISNSYLEPRLKAEIQQVIAQTGAANRSNRDGGGGSGGSTKKSTYFDTSAKAVSDRFAQINERDGNASAYIKTPGSIEYNEIYNLIKSMPITDDEKSLLGNQYLK